ncbi:retropepsin-like aspartic protease family protein [Roseateles violae]|uniref:Retropepsin-like aspartic protease n=1 Tax=Roseateles violae TaxID=3058042 RepID=A0ABT8DT72_9BURK|nr:retropepsin-like aspartic protease [Pelomonas sp. PFR6]MDN3919562.1 retropepsin-like aspartic protease [Pelomonas sp. PFR6]
MNDANKANRELPGALKIATVWLLIGLAVFLAFQAWERQRLQSRFSLSPQGQIVLQRGPDGHFHWPGTLNGIAVDFLVDTGASSSAVPEALARRAGLRSEGDSLSHTAGGVARGWLARGDLALQGGVGVERLRLTVLPQLGAPLLGMDVLAKLQFTQQGGELRIEAARP